jgi:hypothetical protein
VKKVLAAVVLAALLAGCNAADVAIGTAESGNKHVNVYLLARVEGCNVYKIDTPNKDIYTTICPANGSITESQWTYNCGKNCNKEAEARVVRKVYP